MPRRTKKTKKETNTYYKAKNGRFYKKVEIDGKMRVRFVSNAEATGALKTAAKKKRTRKPKVQKEEQAQPEEEEKPEVQTE